MVLRSLRWTTHVLCTLSAIGVCTALVPSAASATAGTVTEFPLAAGQAPSGITKGPDGNIWFTEETHAVVGQVTPSGVITSFSVPNSGGGLGGIASGPDGNVWFTATRNNAIERMTVAGAVTTFPVPTPSAGLAGIAVGTDGNL
jgi:virginiamycin B lyase